MSSQLCGSLVLSAAAEGHFSSGSRNCAAARGVSPPLRLVSSIALEPARKGWYLDNGQTVLFAAGEGLVALDLPSGSTSYIGFPAPYGAVQGSVDSLGLYMAHVAGDAPFGLRPLSLVSFSSSAPHGLRWAVEVQNGADSISGPVSNPDGILVGSGSTLHMLSRDGKRLWIRSYAFSLGTFLSIASGTAVIPNSTGLDAVALLDGRHLWHRDVPADVMTPYKAATIVGEVIFFPTSDKQVAALSAANGRSLWQVSVPSEIDPRHPILHSSSSLIVPLFEGLAALDPETGSQRWHRRYSFLTLRQALPTVLATPEAIFVGGRDGLYALAPATGDILWQAEGLGEIASLNLVGHALVAFNSLGSAFVFEESAP